MPSRRPQNGHQIFGVCETLLQYPPGDTEAGAENTVSRKGALDSNHTLHFPSMLPGEVCFFFSNLYVVNLCVYALLLNTVPYMFLVT